jgi:hypothetical protein
MLTGRSFTLATSTLAIDTVNGRRTAVTISAGDVVKILAVPGHGGQKRMVDVLWRGRTVAMFTSDVKERGTEISDGAASA